MRCYRIGDGTGNGTVDGTGDGTRDGTGLGMGPGMGLEMGPGMGPGIGLGMGLDPRWDQGWDWRGRNEGQEGADLFFQTHPLSFTYYKWLFFPLPAKCKRDIEQLYTSYQAILVIIQNKRKQRP